MKETSSKVLGEASRKSEAIQHTFYIRRGYGTATIGVWKSETEKAPDCQSGWVCAEFCAWTRSEYQRDIRACEPAALIGFTLAEIAQQGRVRILNSKWFGDFRLTEDGKLVRPTSYQYPE